MGKKENEAALARNSASYDQLSAADRAKISPAGWARRNNRSAAVAAGKKYNEQSGRADYPTFVSKKNFGKVYSDTSAEYSRRSAQAADMRKTAIAKKLKKK